MEAAIYVKKHEVEFPAVGNFHNYETRQINDLQILNYRMTNFKKSPHCFSSYVFNKLPIQIKNQNSFRAFKKDLCNYLYENSFYTFNEYFAT
jgi:hypothetical protein